MRSDTVKDRVAQPGKGAIDLMIPYREGQLEPIMRMLEQLGFKRQSTRSALLCACTLQIALNLRYATASARFCQLERRKSKPVAASHPSVSNLARLKQYNLEVPAEKNHPVFRKASNPNIKIWRYMNFAKYVSFLEESALHFGRSDKFEDPLEGSFPLYNVRKRQEVYTDSGGMTDEQFNRFSQNFSSAMKQHRQRVFLNCWHMNEYESVAMWRLYAKTNEAMAIQSTYANLHKCLPAGIFVGEVRYIDFDTEWVPEDNSFHPYVHKRKSFEHERELRAVLDTGLDKVPHTQATEFGHLIAVSIEHLLENVYVGPTAPAWFGAMVEKVTRKYDIDKPVVHSLLNQDPVF